MASCGKKVVPPGGMIGKEGIALWWIASGEEKKDYPPSLMTGFRN